MDNEILKECAELIKCCTCRKIDTCIELHSVFFENNRAFSSKLRKCPAYKYYYLDIVMHVKYYNSIIGKMNEFFEKCNKYEQI